jgi:hypothetical protein
VDGEISVAYTTSDGTATAMQDYTPVSGTLVFSDGMSLLHFSVPITDDTQMEGEETIVLVLHDPTGGATLGDVNEAVLTLRESITDSPGVLPFSSTTYSKEEAAGNAVITVNRLGGAVGEVTVAYSTSDGTAVAGMDYEPASGILSFADGVQNREFTVPILDDALAEGQESIILTLSNATGGAVLGAPSTATLFIIDDEGHFNYLPLVLQHP